MTRNPDRVNEMSSATEDIYETPLVTVYALRKIRDGRYDDTYRVTVILKNDDGVSEEELGELIAGLDEVGR